ncbi:MAG: Asp-tRNA(Asn)/Glu-tRNA(Gln) amidotransferase subunit GatB [Candidatus Marinimicrobia bacterium]|nr:Asp-tRNA(Asn)/Glu-tRNA(Gln) amidotransferase subunit GatB [Candidatus Neomarinimicrobiota bacterium]
MSYKSIIGLEIHVELKTKTKMFCGCSAPSLGEKPNTHVCPVCLGLPGALPVANQKAVEATALVALALGGQIPRFTKFDRKNYFYPDLPKGYQISQYDLPLGKGGHLGSIKVRRVHLEEDTAKLIHLGQNTLIDFNRSCVPLMEIVTEPEIKTPQEAKWLLKRLQQILRYLDVSDCDMEKGSMRLEANISVKKATTPGLPQYKVEIKNLNSFRFVEKALIFEIARQEQCLKQGKKINQETRGWDAVKQRTFVQRFKEEAQDYRYFPEPDLPPVVWNQKQLTEIKKRLLELPEAKNQRFQKDYGLTEAQAMILTETQIKADYFEEAVKLGKKHGLQAQTLANVMINKRVNIEKYLPAKLIRLLKKKRTKPSLEDKQLKLVIVKIVRENQKTVADYRQGKTNAIEFLVGQVMQVTKGAADPNQTRKILLEKMAIKK